MCVARPKLSSKITKIVEMQIAAKRYIPSFKWSFQSCVNNFATTKKGKKTNIQYRMSKNVIIMAVPFKQSSPNFRYYKVSWDAAQ